MITFYKTIRNALATGGVLLVLYSGTRLVCVLAGYSSVADAVADSVLAASIFGGTVYKVVETRRRIHTLRE